MGITNFLRQMIGLDSAGYSDAPTFRCIRCGEEYERNYNSCPDCGAQFVVRADEE